MRPATKLRAPIMSPTSHSMISMAASTARPPHHNNRVGFTAKPCGHGSRKPANALTVVPRPLPFTFVAAPAAADVGDVSRARCSVADRLSDMQRSVLASDTKMVER